MKKSQRISRRAIRNFLQLTAAAFAFSGELPVASATHGAMRPVPPSVSRGEAANDADAVRYQHTFSVDIEDADYPARINVAATDGRSAIMCVMHVPGRLGPLADGAYRVTIDTHSGGDVQLVRIGPDTDRYLTFLSATDTA